MTQGRGRRRGRADSSEVSLCIKYLVFGFNVMFWLFGAAIIVVSAWAWQEKGSFDNFGSLTGLGWLDPVLFLLIIGIIVFLIGFFGCVGALRENTTLLSLYSGSLTIILLCMIICGVLVFAFKGKIEDKIKDQLIKTIDVYRDDSDLQFLIDWVQKDWLKCCGINSPDDWDSNVYFNCSSPSREACGVPYSCCITDGDTFVNTQCGYDSRVKDVATTSSTKIYVDGCVDAGKTWLNKNIIPIAGVLVGIALLQVSFILMSNRLKEQIMKDKKKGLYNLKKF